MLYWGETTTAVATIENEQGATEERDSKYGENIYFLL